jgi:hypothetical protein
MSVNGTLVDAKMCIFTLESKYFFFNKCPIYNHDDASAKFSTNSHETDYSAYMTLNPISSEFSYEENLVFFFISARGFDFPTLMSVKGAHGGVGRVPIPTRGHKLWYSLYIRTLWSPPCFIAMQNVAKQPGFYFPTLMSVKGAQTVTHRSMATAMVV